jgi:hypothetical protein
VGSYTVLDAVYWRRASGPEVQGKTHGSRACPPRAMESLRNSGTGVPRDRS